MAVDWQPIATAPKVDSIWMQGPRGGKFRATWMFGLMGVPGWHRRWGDEWVHCGSDYWAPINRK